MTYCKPYWTDKMWAQAKQLRESGKSFGEVARAMGLATIQVQHRFANFRYKKNAANRNGSRMLVKAGLVVPEWVLEDRARRLSAERTLSQMLMGDPLPEDSALGRRIKEMRRIFVDNGMVCLEKDGHVCMKLDCSLDVGFRKTAVAMSDDELWQYYERRRHADGNTTRPQINGAMC